jgi:hypothetical protein
MHLPDAQIMPPWQVLAQAPQFLGSLLGSMQIPEHSICPMGQDTAHLPDTHS